MTAVFTGAEPDELWPLIRSYHYSRRMPSNIQHCYAVREAGGLFGDHGKAIAGVIFSIPPTRWKEDVIELSRLVRVPECAVSLSALISFACRWLKKAGVPLVVSFADRTHGHHGGVYQSCGWHYDGCRACAMDGVVIDGVFKPGRSCNSQWGTRSPDKLRELLRGKDVRPHFDEGKHLYWRALCIAGRTKAKRLELKSLPYVKPDAARPVDEQPTRLRERGATPRGRSNSDSGTLANSGGLL